MAGTLNDMTTLQRQNAGLRNRLDMIVSAVRRLEEAPATKLHDRLNHLFEVADYAASEPATDVTVRSR